MITYRTPIPFPAIDNSPFNAPYPNRERRIENEIRNHSPQRSRFRGIPTQFPIRVEEHACYCDGGIAEC